MLKKILNSKYFLAAIGLIYLIYYIWFHFIRERLPKDIPFYLTLLGFIMIIYIIIFYSYMLLRLFKPKAPSPIILKLLAMGSRLLTPWLILDNLIKENFYIKSYYEKLLQKIIEWPDHNTIFMHCRRLYINFFILPKGIILLIFCVDVFYFHQLKYFYTVIPLSLIPIFTKYFLYSLNVYVNSIIAYLQQGCLVVILSEDSDDKHYYIDIEGLRMLHGEGYLDLLINLKQFIELQVTAIQYQYTLYEYDCWIIGYGTVSLNDQTNIMHIEFARKFTELVPIAIKGTVILDTMTSASAYRLIILLHKLILIIYLLCWTYILLVSIHTLNIIEILKIFKSIYENPFL